MKIQQLGLILLLIIPGILSAESKKDIYVWIDEHGNKVYGDAPQKKDKAEALELEPLNILGFPELKENKAAPAAEKKIITGVEYSTFDITSPAHDDSIRDNLGKVMVTLEIEPALAQGHSIQLFLDSSPYQQPKASASILMENIDRGSHTVQAKLLDSNGEVIKESSTVPFHLHRFFQKPSQ